MYIYSGVICSIGSCLLSELEYDVLSEWFKYLVSNPAAHVDLFGIFIFFTCSFI